LSRHGHDAPRALQNPDDIAALQLLHRYYGGTGYPSPAVGAAFDAWDSTGTRAKDVDRFTADDLVAVTFLSVKVGAPAARRLLVDDAQRFPRCWNVSGRTGTSSSSIHPWSTSGPAGRS
jgi:hypothetical protein